MGTPPIAIMLHGMPTSTIVVLALIGLKFLRILAGEGSPLSLQNTMIIDLSIL